jgi:hypothetical protein
MFRLRLKYLCVDLTERLWMISSCCVVDFIYYACRVPDSRGRRGDLIIGGRAVAVRAVLGSEVVSARAALVTATAALLVVREVRIVRLVDRMRGIHGHRGILCVLLRCSDVRVAVRAHYRQVVGARRKGVLSVRCDRCDRCGARHRAAVALLKRKRYLKDNKETN